MDISPLRPDQIDEIERLGVVVRNKLDSWAWRLVGVFFWTWHRSAWTTWRWPWNEQITIWASAGTSSITMHHIDKIDHELFHCRDLRPRSGPWKIGVLNFLVPLPLVFSGRWFVERWAYLEAVRRGTKTVDSAVDKLFSFTYLYPWPPPLMRRWFKARLKDGQTQTNRGPT